MGLQQAGPRLHFHGSDGASGRTALQYPLEASRAIRAEYGPCDGIHDGGGEKCRKSEDRRGILQPRDRHPRAFQRGHGVRGEDSFSYYRRAAPFRSRPEGEDHREGGKPARARNVRDADPEDAGADNLRGSLDLHTRRDAPREAEGRHLRGGFLLQAEDQRFYEKTGTGGAPGLRRVPDDRRERGDRRRDLRRGARGLPEKGASGA